MADNPNDRDDRSKQAAQGDDLPAPLPRPGDEQREEQRREEEPVDGEFQVIREQIGRLIRQEIRQEITIVREEIRELHIGPLPHEKTLEAYERIVPGSAKMIFDNFEEQGKHRRYLEKYALKWGTVRSFAGLACGFIVTMIVLIFSYMLIADDHGVEGTILATIDLVALAGVFVYGTHVLREERVQKAKIMAGRQDEDKAKTP
jgi:uncharacterized membrane protein